MNNWIIINDIKIHVISYLLDKNKAFRVSCRFTLANLENINFAEPGIWKRCH